MNYVTKSEIARRYGYDTKAVDRWVNERGANVAWDSNVRKFREKDVTEWIVKNIIEPLRTVDTSEATKLAKLRKLEAEARIAEMDERTQAGSLIPVQFVQAALNMHSTKVRASMLQIATTQSLYLLEQATDQRSLKTALTKVITERLTEIGQAMETGEYLDANEVSQYSEFRR